MDYLLPNWLSHRAAVLPNQPALLADGARWTFAALDRWASAMARGLLARGVAPSDWLRCCCVIVPSSWRWPMPLRAPA